MNPTNYLSLIEGATGRASRSGNLVTILHNGDEIFPAMLDAIRGAKNTIEFLTYVFWRSEVANEFAAVLCERARAGVTVRLLVDTIGSAYMDSRTVWKLERAGVEVAWFRPGHWPHLHKLNSRTHRKVLLVDGYIGFTGGVGIGDVWTGSAQDILHWRETHCLIVGPACADLHVGFAENWFEATHQRLMPIVPVSPRGDIAIHTTISSAGMRPTAIEQLIGTALAAAQRRLWITSAYFVPSGRIINALVQAVARGVDVRVLTNGSLIDYKVTLFAARASYQQLLEGGVKIYEYQQTMHHAKIITADSSWATLGSANLDSRSLVLNDELNISVVDPGVIGILDLQFLADLEKSQHIRLSQWSQRGWASRLAESSTRMFRHQL